MWKENVDKEKVPWGGFVIGCGQGGMGGPVCSFCCVLCDVLWKMCSEVHGNYSYLCWKLQENLGTIILPRSRCEETLMKKISSKIEIYSFCILKQIFVK